MWLKFHSKLQRIARFSPHHQWKNCCKYSSSSTTPLPSSKYSLNAISNTLRLSSPWEIFGHLGFILGASSLLVSDIAWLRFFSICANLCGITYNLKVPPVIPKLIVRWQCFFISVNIVQIVRILSERRDSVVPEQEAELYKLIFASVYTPVEFKKVINKGEWVSLQPGEKIYSQVLNNPVGDDVNRTLKSIKFT